MLIARQALNADKCTGCGDYLTDTETTDLPMNDSPDHYYRMHMSWCRRCVAHTRWARQQAPQDDQLDGTPGDNFPQARRVWSERLPLPPR